MGRDMVMIQFSERNGSRSTKYV